MDRPNEDTAAGLAFAVSAYFLWGFLAIYMKMLNHIPPVEVVAHRIIWSLPIAFTVLLFMGRLKDIATALRTPKMLAMGFLTAGLISINWFIYVWAITHDRALDAALAYFINPLFSVLLGAVLLRERLTRPQLIAVGLAGIAVAYLAYDAGSVPWIAVTIFVSWGFYAYFKKMLPIGPNQGFLLEVLVLVPIALGYVLWLGRDGQSHFLQTSVSDTWLLIGCGIVTAGPLMLFSNGARGLRLSTIAILQYIVPTMLFLIAVFVFDEPFDQSRQIAFPMIWAALVIYSWSLLREMRRAR